MPLALLLAYLVFLKRIDVRVEIKNGWTYPVLQQPLDNGRGARCTAGMQEYLGAPIGNNNGGLFHCQRFTIIVSAAKVIKKG